MAESRTQMEAQINFNQIIHNEDYAGKKITPYTWIYRWQNEQEFGINERLTVIANAKQVISLKKNRGPQIFTKYIWESAQHNHIPRSRWIKAEKLQQRRPLSHYKLAQCSPDKYSFILLKKILTERECRPYTMTCPKVYNQYGLCRYFEKEPSKKGL